MSSLQVIKAEEINTKIEDVEMEGMEEVTDLKDDEDEFNLQEAITTLVGAQFSGRQPQLSQSRLNELKKSVSLVVARQQSRNPDRMAISKEEEWNHVREYLWILMSVEEMTVDLNTSTNLKNVLEILKDPAKNMPLPYQQISQHLYDLYASQNWGAALESPPPTTTAPTSTGNRKAKMSSSWNPQSSNVPTAVSHPAPDDHPIYGLRGCMHNIRRKVGARASYDIDPKFVRKPANVFGHNGFSVGDCWPLQIAALRDSVHGRTVAGIHGTLLTGCYSIVISAGYELHDLDTGAVVLYSSPHSTSSPHDNDSAKCLKRSITTQLPVRVLRTSKGHWVGAPREGIRYDGLYRVVSVQEKSMQMVGKGKDGKGKGGVKTELFLQFRLERLDLVGGEPQAKIDTSRPDREMIRDFEKVQMGY